MRWTISKTPPELCPVCVKHMDCFANKNQRCTILDDTGFGKRDCPFYKTLDVWMDEMEEYKRREAWRAKHAMV